VRARGAALAFGIFEITGWLLLALASE